MVETISHAVVYNTIMVIYVMRHGETIAQHTFCGWRDIALGEKGKTQTKNAIDSLLGEPIEVVYSTGLQRTDDAAKYFISQQSIPHIIEPKLKELNFGECEGLTAEEITEKYPAVTASWQTRDNVFYPHGESLEDLKARVWATLDDIIALGKTPLLIVHHGVIRAIYMYFQGGDFRDYGAENAEIILFNT